MTLVLKSGKYKVLGDQGEYILDNVLITVIEITDKIAKAINVDLVSIAAGVIDSAAVFAIKRELGLTGRAYIKRIKGQLHLVLKGFPAERANLKGTHYRLDNPKVAHLIVSPKDLARSAGRVTGLAVVAYSALNVVEFLFSEEDQTLVSLIGNVAMDIFKFAAAVGAGFLAGVAIGTITTMVAAPVAMAIFVSFAAGIVLDRIDRKYQLTESLIKALEKAADIAMSPLDRVFYEIHRWERWLIKRATNDRRYHRRR